MELKEGYKQTKVGVIPEDWNPTSIGGVAVKVGSGITPTGGSSVYKSSGRPFVRSQNVGWGALLLDDLAHIDEETHQTFPATELKKSDVLLNITGASIGRSAFVDERLDGGNVNQHVCIIRVPHESFAARYFNYFLLSRSGQRQIDSFQAGGNREGLNFGQIRSLSLPLPPTKAEQEAIAEALSDADALIESLEQLIAKKRQIKQGAMQELLTGQKRLPGFSGEWEVKRLGELGKCYRGVSYTPLDLSPHDTAKTIRLLRSNNVQNSSIVFSDMQYVDTCRVSEHQELCEKDVLICMANGSRQLVGKAGQFSSHDSHKYTFGAFMGIFRPDTDEADSDYVFMLFSTEAYRHHIDLLLAGSSINNLTPGSVEELQLLMPQPDEQTAIATILSDMDAEIAALETKLSKARQVKQGMMQELLTGSIRLVEPQAAASS